MSRLKQIILIVRQLWFLSANERLLAAHYIDRIYTHRGAA